MTTVVIEQPVTPMQRVLIIDDDPLFRRVLVRILARAGFATDDVANGAAALALLESAATPFSVAFVDVEMAGWDGLETSRRLWAVDPDLPIVISTGSDTFDNFHDRLGRSDALVIKKPVEAIEVVQAAFVSSMRRSMAQQARRHVEELEEAVRERTTALELANRQLADELAWRDRLETELRLGHRLEAVGQLAAGIAHEINTPIQYVGDNLQFLWEGMGDLMRVVEGARTLVAKHSDPKLACEFAQLVTAADLGYVTAELPGAFESIQFGVRRIAEIVRAMKDLSHPGPRELSASDLNRALESALEVTASAYRYVADLDKQLEPMPAVRCHIAELGQVFLNLIINAAQAMEHRQRDKRGTLGIRSRVDGDDVVIAISDTGGGIPDAIRDRVFDAFFTTKPVGKGSGQGLAISRAIIVDRHQGSLTFESAVGVGTTFQIRLPIAGPTPRPA